MQIRYPEFILEEFLSDAKGFSPRREKNLSSFDIKNTQWKHHICGKSNKSRINSLNAKDIVYFGAATFRKKLDLNIKRSNITSRDNSLK